MSRRRLRVASMCVYTGWYKIRESNLFVGRNGSRGGKNAVIAATRACAEVAYGIGFRAVAW